MKDPAMVLYIFLAFLEQHQIQHQDQAEYLFFYYLLKYFLILKYYWRQAHFYPERS